MWPCYTCKRCTPWFCFSECCGSLTGILADETRARCWLEEWSISGVWISTSHISTLCLLCHTSRRKLFWKFSGRIVITSHRFRQTKYLSVKWWIFSYPSVLTYVLGAQKTRLIDTVLLSTHDIYFGWEIRKLNFWYTLLTKVLTSHTYTYKHTRTVWCMCRFILGYQV